MTGFWVDMVKPEYYLHWMAYADLADGLTGALDELGVLDVYDTPIVLGAHLLSRPLPRNAIVMNTEVYGSGWFTKEYLGLLAAHRVWDYSRANIHRMGTHAIDAEYCGLGYHETLSRITLKPEAERDIDVLFYGSMTPRREGIWKDICSTGLNCVHLFGVYGEARDAYIARSKIVLNLHAYPQSPREDVRLSYLWANKAFVLSEGNGGVFEYAANQLPASCVEWVKRDHDRQFFASAIHDSFVKQRQADYLRPLIAAEKAAA